MSSTSSPLAAAIARIARRRKRRIMKLNHREPPWVGWSLVDFNG